MHDNKIGMNIKKYRKGKFTQQELADKIGKTESSIRKYEKGLVSVPLDVLNEIASVLNIKVYDLIGISSLRKNTSFFDFLASLGYEIGPSEHQDFQMHILTTDSYIELNSHDIKLLEELEDSTTKDIKRTIELLIATKAK